MRRSVRVCALENVFCQEAPDFYSTPTGTRDSRHCQQMSGTAKPSQARNCGALGAGQVSVLGLSHALDGAEHCPRGLHTPDASGLCVLGML